MNNVILRRSAWAGICLLLSTTLAPAQGIDQPAIVIVRLPADARLTFEGQAMKQTGAVRRFYTPPLPAGAGFHYLLEATWTRDGKAIKQRRTVHVRAGMETVVDLTKEDRPPDKPPVDKPPIDKPPTDKPKPPPEPEVEDVPFVPTPQEVVDKMLDLAEVKKDDLVYDLGCGDGRIVVTAAKKYRCKAVGFDINPRRIEESKDSVKEASVGDLVTIKKQNIFDVDLTPASVVTLYLLPRINVQLVPQLERMKPGSRIVSHAFDIEGYKPKKVATVKDKEGQDHKVYLWTVPLEKDKP